MFEEDLYLMTHATWSLDGKCLPGRMRVQQSLMWSICAVTATRPGAILALTYEHIQIMRVRDRKNPKLTETVALVTLVHVKRSGGRGRR